MKNIINCFKQKRDLKLDSIFLLIRNPSGKKWMGRKTIFIVIENLKNT